MVWTPPMTAVNGDPFSAAEYNTHIRDNLLETMPAQAVLPTRSVTQGGGRRWFMTDTKNRIRARAWHNDRFSSLAGTTSSSYTDLIAGPILPLDGVPGIRTSGRALVYLSSSISIFSARTTGYMSFAFFDTEGNEAIPADDLRAVSTVNQISTSWSKTVSGVFIVDGLVPEAPYVVRARFRVEGEATPLARFVDRDLVVIEL